MNIIERLDDSNVTYAMGKLLKQEADDSVLVETKGEFSKGEELTEADLELISKRTRRVNRVGLEWTDSDYTNLGQAALSWNPEVTVNSYEMQYDPDSTFNIGDNNIKGGL